MLKINRVAKRCVFCRRFLSVGRLTKTWGNYFIYWSPVGNLWKWMSRRKKCETRRPYRDSFFSIFRHLLWLQRALIYANRKVQKFLNIRFYTTCNFWHISNIICIILQDLKFMNFFSCWIENESIHRIHSHFEGFGEWMLSSSMSISSSRFSAFDAKLNSTALVGCQI